MIYVTVREFARLTTQTGRCGLDEHTIEPSAFNYLCDLASTFRRSGAQIGIREGAQSLRLDQYVGVIETPCGTVIEVVPKCADEAADAKTSRGHLRKMLVAAMGLRTRDAGDAHLQTLQYPLTEWVMHQFIESLRVVVRQGIRNEYHRVQVQTNFLRGRLQLAKQARQPPGRQHLFHVEYDEFLPNRAENRLLRSALSRVLKATTHGGTWRVAHELSIQLSSIPESDDVEADFSRWSTRRLLAHYAPVRPWCELVLGREMPLALHGTTRGRSLLFPMDKLFERYVGAHLGTAIEEPFVLVKQHAGAHLVRHAPADANGAEANYFALIPDFLVRAGEQGAVQLILDTKWKRLDTRGAAVGPDQPLYGMAHSDLYQMFAYGQKYLAGQGDLVLIYPRCSTFTAPLPVLRLSENLRLWAVPFDLESDTLCEVGATLGSRWLRQVPG